MNRESSNRIHEPSLGVGLDSVEVGFPTGSQDVLRKKGARQVRARTAAGDKGGAGVDVAGEQHPALVCD